MKLSLRDRLHQLGGLYRRSWQERSVDTNHPLDAVRRHQRRVPGNCAAPIMADNDAPFDTEGVEHADYVRNKLPLGIRFDGSRRVRFAVASLIGCEGAKTGCGERPHLMPPRIPEFRKSVTHHNRIASA